MGKHSSEVQHHGRGQRVQGSSTGAGRRSDNAYNRVTAQEGRGWRAQDLGVLRGLWREQLGADEAGLDEHGADPERRDLRGQRLHPALHRELRSGIGAQEFPALDAGGQGNRDEEVAGFMASRAVQLGAAGRHTPRQPRFRKSCKLKNHD